MERWRRTDFAGAGMSLLLVLVVLWEGLVILEAVTHVLNGVHPLHREI
jgi:hypothetical protein